jgi:hypothetical protein
MIDVLSDARELLRAAGFSVERASGVPNKAISFESSVCIGFLFCYEGPGELLSNWERDSQQTVTRFGLSLRLAGVKAWNVYLILLATGMRDEHSQSLLNDIEENLVGTRKIARCGISNADDLRAALLPLLPIQAAPSLEAIDLPREIKARTGAVPASGVDAFLSPAIERVVVDILEGEL